MLEQEFNSLTATRDLSRRDFVAKAVGFRFRRCKLAGDGPVERDGVA